MQRLTRFEENLIDIFPVIVYEIRHGTILYAKYKTNINITHITPTAIHSINISNFTIENIKIDKVAPTSTNFEFTVVAYKYYLFQYIYNIIEIGSICRQHMYEPEPESKTQKTNG